MTNRKVNLSFVVMLGACALNSEPAAESSISTPQAARAADAAVEAGVRAAPRASSTPSVKVDAGVRAATRTQPPRDAGVQRAPTQTTNAGDTAADSGMEDGCTTRITYGSAWIRPTDHPDNTDRVGGAVSWDGSCQTDASGHSFAQLSNGWRPYFTGRNGCVIALDLEGSCAPAAPAHGCSTRVTYNPSWLHPDGHSEAFDDVDGVITTDGQCNADGESSYLQLSNGWRPHFMGQDSCSISLRYSQCRGLFANPVIARDCPDPSVLRDGDQYVMACTSGNPAYPLHTSRDLVTWKLAGSIFSEASKPEWAERDFWAPEIHRIGDKYVAYFSARHRDGDLAIGVATANAALGPYEDRGEPLVRDPEGAIDAHHFEAPDGTHYLIWKLDGNANGHPTPIVLQPLAADGLALTGSPTTLLSNTEAWEANSIEGPWLIFESGYYYLFYSGNTYLSAGYALGVARSTSITGPFTKAPEPLLVSSGLWAGPGHGAAVRGPAGDWVFVFHAWAAGRIGQSPPGRQVLLSRIRWADGWPSMLGAPSSLSQPLP